MAKVIKLVNQTNKISLKQKTQNVTVRSKTQKVVIKTSGRPGERGPVGHGMPTGGAAGDILVKQSNEDYDATFVAPSELADKNYVHNFNVSSSVTVNHNLNKYPSVTVFDSAGDEVVGEVYYVNTSQVQVTFNNPFSGKVICN